MEETSHVKAEPEIQSAATGEAHSGISDSVVPAQREGQATLMIDDQQWEHANARRCDLIRRKFTEGISVAEQAELVDLDRFAASHLNTIAPIPAFPLDELQLHVDRIKAATKHGA